MKSAWITWNFDEFSDISYRKIFYDHWNPGKYLKSLEMFHNLLNLNFQIFWNHTPKLVSDKISRFLPESLFFENKNAVWTLDPIELHTFTTKFTLYAFFRPWSFPFAMLRRVKNLDRDWDTSSSNEWGIKCPTLSWVNVERVTAVHLLQSCEM